MDTELRHPKTMQVVTRMRKNSGNDVMSKLSHYERVDEERIPQRVARFLDFAARVVPGVPIAWNIVLKHIMGYARTPQPDNQEAIRLMDKAGAARKHLMATYGRGLVNARGQGVRATVDGDDMANTQFRNNMSRLVSAKRSADNTRALIDTKTMKDRTLKAYVEGATPALKSLDALARLDKLLPEAKK